MFQVQEEVAAAYRLPTGFQHLKALRTSWMSEPLCNFYARVKHSLSSTDMGFSEYVVQVLKQVMPCECV